MTLCVLEVLLSFLLRQDDGLVSFSISVCCACWRLLFTLWPCVYLGVQLQEVQYHPPNASWPNPEIMKAIPFDYTVHDPKYDDISSVYNPAYKPSAEGGHSFPRRKKWDQMQISTLLNFMLIKSVKHYETALFVLAKETLCARRRCSCAGGRAGLSSPNTQLTIPTITVNSVTSTWASTTGTRWAKRTMQT